MGDIIELNVGVLSITMPSVVIRIGRVCGDTPTKQKDGKNLICLFKAQMCDNYSGNSQLARIGNGITFLYHFQ